MLTPKARAIIDNLKRDMATDKKRASTEIKFNALSDFERRVVLQAAGVKVSFFDGRAMRPIHQFGQLKEREKMRVQAVLPMLARLGERVAA